MTALNIKNEETVRLARELAELEGKSLTMVVTEALREKLERDHQSQVDEERVQYWLQVGRELRAAADPEWLARDPFQDLYDEAGLPR